MIGQIVGNYKIETKLGEGGMGAVYKGVDTMLDREVAIKALRPELASQTSVVERFRSEAVTLAKLNHPNIATLYSLFRQGEELYMVLEFVRGETLDNILQRRGALPPEEAIPVFCQVLDGINHAHDLGIVHRDIKPANMMLTENGTLKVLDFGIARLLGSARMTRAGNIIGTLEYMAPEQVKGQETDARSDIYALGMMLYEVLTGRLAFDTENEFELMKLQTETMPPNPRQINPAIPEEVDAAIMYAIQKNPDDRFQTAGEFMEMLLGAGFTKVGSMHGMTGSYARPMTHPSRPPISQSGASNPGISPTQAETVQMKATRLGAPTAPLPSSVPPSEEVTVAFTVPEGVKETRLGVNPATAAAAPAGAMKATRLGDAQSFAAPQQANTANAAGTSFLSNLTAVHYAGAGVAALVLIGILIAVPVMLLGGSSEAVAEEKKTEQKKPDESQKPEVITMPQQTQNQPTTVPDANPPAQTQPTDVKPVELDTALQKPADNKPAEKPAEKPVEKPVSKPADKPTTVAQKPAAPPPPKKEAPKQTKPSGSGGRSRAEDLLTGN